MSYLFTAYLIIWIVLFLYLMSLSQRQKRLDQELETLRRLVAEKR
jgi:CcmD family protein